MSHCLVLSKTVICRLVSPPLVFLSVLFWFFLSELFQPSGGRRLTGCVISPAASFGICNYWELLLERFLISIGSHCNYASPSEVEGFCSLTAILSRADAFGYVSQSSPWYGLVIVCVTLWNVNFSFLPFYWNDIVEVNNAVDFSLGFSVACLMLACQRCQEIPLKFLFSDWG